MKLMLMAKGIGGTNLLVLALATAAACLGTASRAVEMRIPAPITSPRVVDTEIRDVIKSACVPAPCARLIAVETIQPVEARTVREAVTRLAKVWNTSDLDRFLGEGFFDRTRLLDTFREVVARDARLRVLSVGNIQTLAQYVEPALDTPPPDTRVSVVRATVATQVEFNDPREGFIRSRRSAQEYLLLIAEEVRF